VAAGAKPLFDATVVQAELQGAYEAIKLAGGFTSGQLSVD